MILSLLMMTTPAASLTQPLTPTHLRDIACVAVIGLAARDQREGRAPFTKSTDLQARGRTWAGIVGNRITEETVLPREVIAAEIQSAALREQQVTKEPVVIQGMKTARVQDCAELMNAELLSQPLPKPVKAGRAAQ